MQNSYLIFHRRARWLHRADGTVSSTAGGSVSSAPASGPTQLVTTVANRQTIISKFESTVISQHTKLRQSTTIKAFENGKGDCSSNLRRRSCLVAAGPIQSCCCCFTHPSTRATRREQRRRQDMSISENQYEERGGADALDMYQSGNDAGYSCDEKNCPTKGNKPNSSDKTCSRDKNNNYTADEHRSSNCKATEQCPEGNDIHDRSESNARLPRHPSQV